jgi:PAS domain S-box-containing protein
MPTLPSDPCLDEVRRLNWTLSAITNVHRALVRAKTEQELFAAICDALTSEDGFPLAWIGVPVQGEAHSFAIRARAGAAQAYLDGFETSSSAGPLDDDPTSRAIRSGRIEFDNDLLSSVQFRSCRERAKSFDFRSCFSMPISLPNGAPCCVLTVYSERPAAFGAYELGLFTRLEADIGFGVDALRTKVAYQHTLHLTEEQEHRLRVMANVFENSAECVLITDADNRIVKVNAAFLRSFGYAWSELVGKNPSLISSGRHDRVFFEKMWKSIVDTGQWQGDIYNYDRDGKEILCRTNIISVRDESGRVLNYVGSMLDITERRRAQDEARREYEFSSAMMESMPGIVYFYDQMGKFRRWNRNFMKISEYGADEVSAMHPTDFFPPEEKDLLQQRIDEVFEKGVSDVEASFLTKSGQKIPYLFTGQRLEFDGAAYLIGVGIDISARRAAENELASYARRLQAVSRQLLEVQESERRALGRELHDSVAQELAAVALNLTILRGILPAESVAAIADRLDDSQALLDQASRHLRDVMVELRPPGLDEFGVLAALREHAERVARRTGLRIWVSGVEPAPRLAPMTAIALFRIAQEALSNVAKHARARHVTLELRELAGEIRLDVADDGEGFDADRPQFEAVGGMGMTTMAERAEAVGATFTVHSERGKGTRITVVLPRTAAMAARRAPAEH